MFSQACVILPAGGMYPSMLWDMLGRCVSQNTLGWQGRGPWKCAVRILLECILVFVVLQSTVLVPNPERAISNTFTLVCRFNYNCQFTTSINCVRVVRSRLGLFSGVRASSRRTGEIPPVKRLVQVESRS